MSHEDFKKIIDSARQILVGKLPNPQDQIDAITYALMYKFMSDIDDQSAALPGGKRTYFADDYEKYGWHNLMRADGQDQLILYREAIEKMSKNAGLPALFREIFNGAMLKFNDPVTLRLFLKEMDKFTHGQNDDLGDTYEYLLSLMGSQGGLGQFRTPRHIIKFIVDAVDPDKTDRIVDPAAGTAGFLIEAYNHIRRRHDGLDENGNQNGEKRLSSAELDTIHQNFRGFDIDPTMIRTARVNLYLHGFKTPDIIEHDTLTSEDYWQDRYDVILANPPFMTPKGGIQPHKKFSIAASRAEVLFVDYISTHLKPNGRAGIVVPDSILTSKNNQAVKQLRKNLINDGLYAVVSLPNGIFLPYSPIKTSILLLDKEVSQRNQDILFVKLTNVGFSLSATQTKIAGSQIPQALEDLQAYRNDQFESNELSFTIDKATVLDDPNYDLIGDKYRKSTKQIDTDYEIVPIGSLVTQRSERVKGRDVPVWSVSNKDGFVDPEKHFSKKVASDDTSNYKVIDKYSFAYNPSRINVGSIALNTRDETGCVSPMYVVFDADQNKVLPEYLFIMLKTDAVHKEINRLASGGARTQLKFDDLSLIDIPLPPLEVQQEIIDKMNSYKEQIKRTQELIRDLERERESFDPRPLAIKYGWPIIKLSELAVVNPKKSNISGITADDEVSFVPMADLPENRMRFAYQQAKPLKEVQNQYTYFADNDVLLAKVTPCFENGKAGLASELLNGVGFGSSEYYVIRASSDDVLPEYLYLNVTNDRIKQYGIPAMTGSVGLQRVPRDFVENYEIPVPPKEIQEQFVHEYDEEQRIIDTNSTLVKLLESKMDAVLATIFE